MLSALLATTLSLQLQRSESLFEVSSVPANGSSRIVGDSRLSSSMSLKRGRNIVWSYASNESKSGWRKEWTYDEKGEMTFFSYEVSFGELKSRWNMTRESGEWTLTGAKSVELPKKTPSIYDESVLWFVGKKVAIGTRKRISALDTGTFAVRRGEAKYLRDEQLSLGAGTVLAHVVEKRFDDEIDVWYVGDKGETWRIDLVYPNANANLVFISRPPRH